MIKRNKYRHINRRIRRGIIIYTGIIEKIIEKIELRSYLKNHF